MKKYYFITIIAFFMGIIILIVGYENQGFQTVSSNSQSGPFVVLKDNQIQKMHTYTTKQKFNSAEISINKADVVIQLGKQYNVKLRSNQKMHLEVKNQHLRIVPTHVKKKPSFIHFNKKNQHSHTRSQLVITLPNAQALQNLKLDTYEAQTQFKNVQITNHLNINDSDGEYQFDNCNLANSHWEVDDCHLLINKSQLHNFKINADNLTARINESQIEGNNNIQSNELYLQLQQLNSNLNFKIRGNIPTYYHNKKYNKEFNHDQAAPNSLDIVGDEGYVKIK
jgi:hypothetical protein